MTIWQKLSQAFGPNALLNQDYPVYKFDKKELLRTTSRSEYEKEKLQAQQSYYLATQWAKVENNLYSQAIYYEPSRLSSQYDYESMEYCLHGDTKIATPDGFITIKELADKGRDYEFTIYAYDHNTSDVVLTKARNAHYTKDEMTYKIIFDDNSHIIATWEHQLMKRDGTFERVKNLKVGDSMMPFYTKKVDDNLLIYSCNDRSDIWVNNQDLINRLTNSPKLVESKVSNIGWDNIVEATRKYKTINLVSEKLGISEESLINRVIASGYNDWDIFSRAYGLVIKNEDILVLNHKIVAIEEYGVVPVYDLTVPGYKNFATDTIFSHNTPEISAALDIYSEESTTTNEDGYILQIYSESKRIKSVLADLFNNVLDINTNLPMWTRNTCKFGDNFVYLKLNPEKGIVGCQQLPTIEIERREAGTIQRITVDPENPDDRKPLTFEWQNKNMTFQSWEIAHFRLLGDDRKLPYGTSMLEKARRIWKQLILSEDAMLIYRTSRAPERRLFKVFVGNMDDNDVEAYVNRVANKFKREQIVDSRTGNVDMRFNQMAVDQDFFIPVRDAAAPDPITTLPGAANLSEIADIEYIQKKLLTALRVPKAFLGFEEVVGDGKNLSLQDIRFARTINRIQKSMLQELNKIAIIHLFILGFEDELSNFTLGLSNPSAQADLLKIDIWKEKVQLYRDLVADPGNGIQATSSTWAKKHIFGWSDEEVKLDLQQQRVERAVGEELKATPTVITKTGIFDNIDKLYGTQTGSTQNISNQSAPPPPPSSSPFGGLDLGLGGEPSLPPSPPAGGPEVAPESPAGETTPPGPTELENLTPENRQVDMNILLDSNLIEGSSIIDLSIGQKSINKIKEELDYLLNS